MQQLVFFGGIFCSSTHWIPQHQLLVECYFLQPDDGYNRIQYKGKEHVFVEGDPLATQAPAMMEKKQFKYAALKCILKYKDIVFQMNELTILLNTIFFRYNCIYTHSISQK